jgi:hypothetical protein
MDREAGFTLVKRDGRYHAVPGPLGQQSQERRLSYYAFERLIPGFETMECAAEWALDHEDVLLNRGFDHPNFLNNCVTGEAAFVSGPELVRARAQAPGDESVTYSAKIAKELVSHTFPYPGYETRTPWREWEATRRRKQIRDADTDDAAPSS